MMASASMQATGKEVTDESITITTGIIIMNETSMTEDMARTVIGIIRNQGHDHD